MRHMHLLTGDKTVRVPLTKLDAFSYNCDVLLRSGVESDVTS